MTRTVEQYRADKRARELATCKHFNGIQNKTCAAGIEYGAVGTPGCWPCLPPFRADATPCTTVCAKREFPTLEEVEAHEAHIRERGRQIGVARAAIIKAIDDNRGVRGSIPCPVCETGTLNFTRAASNGHVWGACTTADCVRWME